MEEELERRGISRLKARIFIKVDDKTAVLNNISEKGMNVSMPVIPKRRRIGVLLKTDDKEIKLSAIIMWAKRKITFGDKNILGLSIVNPPPEYYEFYKKIG